MLRYLRMLKNETNKELVVTILEPITEGDQLTEQVIRNNLSWLPLLHSIGEREIYEAVVNDLQEDETYSQYMGTQSGA